MREGMTRWMMNVSVACERGGGIFGENVRVQACLSQEELVGIGAVLNKLELRLSLIEMGETRGKNYKYEVNGNKGLGLL